MPSFEYKIIVND